MNIGFPSVFIHFLSICHRFSIGFSLSTFPKLSPLRRTEGVQVVTQVPGEKEGILRDD